MSTSLLYLQLCSVCKQPVELKSDKIDSYGRAIHPECDLKIFRLNPAPPARSE
jgi:hypothetical protein